MRVQTVPVVSTYEIKPGACLALLPLGMGAEPLPEPEHPKYDIHKILIAEKLAKQNLRAFGFLSYDQMELSDFRDYLKQQSLALSRSISSSDVERAQKLFDSVKSSGDLKEMLADTKSFHLEAKLGEEEFVKELF